MTEMPTADQLAFLESCPDMPGAVPTLLEWYRDLMVKYTDAVRDYTALLAEVHRRESEGDGR